MAAWFGFHQRLEQDQVVIVGVRGPPCSLASLTTSFAYEQFSCLNRPDHRCLAKYSSWNLSMEWQTVWSNLQLWRFLHPVRDTNWMIAHAVLSTADRLSYFGVRVSSACHCGAPKTLIHLFTQFPFALRLAAWYESMVCRILRPASVLNQSQLLVGYDRLVRIPPVFPCLLGILHHQIWIARNGYRYSNTPVDYPSTLARVKSSLHWYFNFLTVNCPCLCGIYHKNMGIAPLHTVAVLSCIKVFVCKVL